MHHKRAFSLESKDRRNFQLTIASVRATFLHNHSGALLALFSEVSYTVAKKPLPFVSQLHYEGANLRIKVTCLQCGATCIGNADVIQEWQSDHQCAAAEKAGD
jgi:hypothetical protein